MYPLHLDILTVFQSTTYNLRIHSIWSLYNLHYFCFFSSRIVRFYVFTGFGFFFETNPHSIFNVHFILTIFCLFVLASLHFTHYILHHMYPDTSIVSVCNKGTILILLTKCGPYEYQSLKKGTWCWLNFACPPPLRWDPDRLEKIPHLLPLLPLSLIRLGPPDCLTWTNQLRPPVDPFLFPFS